MDIQLHTRHQGATEVVGGWGAQSVAGTVLRRVLQHLAFERLPGGGKDPLLGVHHLVPEAGHATFDTLHTQFTVLGAGCGGVDGNAVGDGAGDLRLVLPVRGSRRCCSASLAAGRLSSCQV